MQVILESLALRLITWPLAMETLRVYRPRIVVYGPVGMGQNYIGTAALHHLEGYHVQNLDLGTLLSDSTRVCLHVAIAERTLTISLSHIRRARPQLCNFSSRRSGTNRQLSTFRHF